MVSETTEATPTQLAGMRALGRPNSFVSEFDFWDDPLASVRPIADPPAARTGARRAGSGS
jgi:hypothetical protein